MGKVQCVEGRGISCVCKFVEERKEERKKGGKSRTSYFYDGGDLRGLAYGPVSLWPQQTQEGVVNYAGLIAVQKQ